MKHFSPPLTLAPRFFLLTFFAVWLVMLPLSFAEATTTPRLEQLVKDTRSASTISSGGELQKISCEDLSGYIIDVAFSLDTDTTPGYISAIFYKQAEGGSGTDISSLVVSNDIFVSNPKQDYIFTFNSPIDIESVCPTPNSYIVIGPRRTPGISPVPNVRFYGSTSSDAYRDAIYDLTTPDNFVKDLYFVINPSSSQNQLPVLDPIGDKIVNEGSLLQFIISATDPDEDTLTFSAVNLPAGASFDSQTATFSWTPDFDDAGVYPGIEFTVTDDGDPVLSSSETITITINDVSPLELTASADSFLRNGNNNRNEGANPHLRIQSSGSNRAAVAFDETAIADYIAENGISSATLTFTIADNGNNWGSEGRTVDAHPLLAAFAEGDGKNAGVPSSESTRGTGAGVTWNCATDTAIENQATDCDPQWNGGLYGAATAPSVLHSNNQSGEVSWDVTADVLNGTFGWLIKKTDEGQNGKMEYYSKEGAAAAENPQFAPRLILTP